MEWSNSLPIPSPKADQVGHRFGQPPPSSWRGILWLGGRKLSPGVPPSGLGRGVVLQCLDAYLTWVDPNAESVLTLTWVGALSPPRGQILAWDSPL